MEHIRLQSDLNTDSLNAKATETQLKLAAKGGKSSPWGSIGQTVGTLGGAALGGYLGGPMGMQMGAQLGGMAGGAAGGTAGGGGYTGGGFMIDSSLPTSWGSSGGATDQLWGKSMAGRGA